MISTWRCQIWTQIQSLTRYLQHNVLQILKFNIPRNELITVPSRAATSPLETTLLKGVITTDRNPNHPESYISFLLTSLTSQSRSSIDSISLPTPTSLCSWSCILKSPLEQLPILCEYFHRHSSCSHHVTQHTLLRPCYAVSCLHAFQGTGLPIWKVNS